MIDVRELGDEVAPLGISTTSRGFVAIIDQPVRTQIPRTPSRLHVLPSHSQTEEFEDVVFLFVFLDRTVDIINGTLVFVVCV